MASWTIDWMIATFSGRDPGLADEAAVDLELVEHGLVQIADRRIAGAEIVERDADAERAQALQHIEGRAIVAEEHAFGDFELDPVAGQLVAGERLADDVRQRRRDDLLGADVERDGDRFRPGRGGAAGFVDHPVADRRHEPAFLGDRDEDVGRDEAALRMIPADQRLEPDQLLGLGVDQRLDRRGGIASTRAPGEGRLRGAPDPPAPTAARTRNSARSRGRRPSLDRARGRP